MALFVVLLLLPIVIVALPANPYSGSTLYSSPAWSTMIATSKAPGTSIAAQPGLSSLATTISTYHDSTWLMSQTNAAAMNTLLNDAATKTAPVAVTFVAYFIPNRNCAGSSAGTSGGASTLALYQTFLNTILAAAQSHPTVRISIIVEPGALAAGCQAAANIAALRAAINTLTAPNIALYLDIGNSGHNPATIATSINTLLSGAATTNPIRGFSTNVFNYFTLAQEYVFITAINTALVGYGYGNMRFVTDTSRNGISAKRHVGEWCNIVGASLGLKPKSTPVDFPLLDAVLWIKTPGQSDGPSPPGWTAPAPNSCKGPNSAANAPATNAWFQTNFAMLLQNAILYSAGPMTGLTLPTPSTGNPFQGTTMYSSAAWKGMIAAATVTGSVIAKSPDMLALAQKIAAYPDATWITSVDLLEAMDAVLAAAATSTSSTVIIVINYIPNRGCKAGQGAASLNAYQLFLNMLANEALAFPTVNVVMIVEPGAVTAIATNACPANNALYTSALTANVNTLDVAPNAVLYIDIGTNSIVPETAIPKVATIISTVIGTSVSVRGLSSNVGMYDPLPVQHDFITAVSSALPSNLTRLRFVVDTSRNGLDTGAASGEWCNLNGAALGMAPTVSPAGYPLIDATLFVKHPTQSDGYSPVSVTSNIAGTCTGPDSMIGAPNQGNYFDNYFVMLLTDTILGHRVIVATSAAPAGPFAATAVSSGLPLPMLMLGVGTVAALLIFSSVVLYRIKFPPPVSAQAAKQQKAMPMSVILARKGEQAARKQQGRHASGVKKDANGFDVLQTANTGNTK